jgi:hypothetical protein
MGLRKVMNRRDVARFHAFLDEDLPIKKISEIMKVTVGCLNNFLPEKVVKSKDAKAKVAIKAADKATATKQA